LEKLLISHDYPHGLLIHILELCKSKGISYPAILSHHDFFSWFQQDFGQHSHEVQEIETGRRLGIIEGFEENQNSPLWKRRVFLSTSLHRLVSEISEKEAVEFIESLMYLFRWEMKITVDRKWSSPPEEQAVFHTFQKPKDSNSSFPSLVSSHDAPHKKELSETNENKDEVKRNNSQAKIDTRVHRKQGTDHDTKQDSFHQKRNQTTAKGTTSLSDGATSSDTTLPPPSTDFLYERVESMSEAEYRQELKKTQLPYQSAMPPSLRREIKKARQGNAVAQSHLGDFYAQEGSGHTDYHQALKWYRFAARQGNLRAKFEIGRLFDSEKIDFANAKEYGIHYFMKLAKEGYPTAQHIIGMKYYLGDGLKENQGKGILWLKKAGLQGCIQSQHQLGDIYQDSDKGEAMKWYQKAMLGGDLLAEKKYKSLRK
jgi:TPR repeat protein